ncbi:MAG: hypothetical protein JO171_00915 [Paludibacterium sp.]|uniref:hypothetical protein n=1 Tax=Paludibacterium sp. TaxID=1917523 RepID=UPI0025F74E05|nr:hypothetical protein [Paludibacterium sp.]MBV8045685.1 hypothetical protein [Paludibacterium sp.]
MIRLPEQLAAENPANRTHLYGLMMSILRALDRQHTVVRLDFTGTRTLFPGGTLIMLAYLGLLLESHPRRIKARCRPKSLAAQLLRHFGLADKLGIDVADSQPTDESVVNWRYLTGTQAEGEPIARMLQSYSDLASFDPPEGLYEVLTEALTNVRQHAYPPGGDVPESMQRWWLFSRFREPTNSRPGNLFIAVYDIGAGIQTTLKDQLQGSAERLAQLGDDMQSLLRLGDSRRLQQVLLQHAIEHQRTSTGLAFRGHGLPEMRDFVQGTATGRLYIISGEAQYSCSPAQNVSDCITCDPAFPGTLILWDLPFQAKELAT